MRIAMRKTDKHRTEARKNGQAQADACDENCFLDKNELLEAVARKSLLPLSSTQARRCNARMDSLLDVFARNDGKIDWERLRSAKSDQEVEDSLQKVAREDRLQLPESKFLLAIVGSRHCPDRNYKNFIARSCYTHGQTSPRRARDLASQEFGKVQITKRSRIREVATDTECHTCKGTGQQSIGQEWVVFKPQTKGEKLEVRPCPTCNGRGRLKQDFAAKDDLKGR